MAMLNESNLLAMKAKAAKFRTHHVGTKLNEAELHEFEALAERRKQTPSELIRGLVLGEIERDKHFVSRDDHNIIMPSRLRRHTTQTRRSNARNIPSKTRSQVENG